MANYRINKDSGVLYISKSKSAADEIDCFVEFSAAKNEVLKRIDHAIADLKAKRRQMRSLSVKDLAMGVD